jgi:hypothetical protein
MCLLLRQRWLLLLGQQLHCVLGHLTSSSTGGDSEQCGEGVPAAATHTVQQTQCERNALLVGTDHSTMIDHSTMTMIDHNTMMMTAR